MTYFPTIHLNGTHPKDLLAGAEKVYIALQHARNQMAENGPNARDYYPQGPDVFRRVADEHAERLNLLSVMIDEYSQLQIHIMDAPGTQGKL
jgi:hypothetical protein